jgi:hypothetical protein
VSATGRLSIRLRSDDLMLLRERAKAREMPTSTYVSLLLRSHLRALVPLPTPELLALKRSVAEIGAIGPEPESDCSCRQSRRAAERT